MAKKRNIRILHVITDQISIIDIPRALDELGYEVYSANFGIHATGYYKEDSRKIISGIEEYNIQCVTSYDFSESISKACMESGVPYIAWVYDAPQKELYTHYALYPCNYIFVFDKVQQQRMRDIGIKNVFFMPLAIHGEKIKRELQMHPHKFGCDVAFVGQLYNVEGTENVVNMSPEYIKKEINECIDKCFMQWNDNVKLHGNMSDECAAYFDSVETMPVEERYPYITKEFYYEAAVLSRMIAHRERIHILNLLAEKHNVNFYTFDKQVNKLSEKVNICPGIKQDGGISCVYRDAKINLNITLHCIETGACQRVFDVMAAGGFLLSNYQKELEELFVPGKEIVMYHNEEELVQMVEYYLAHDKEREEIARNGQRKVLAYHDFHAKLSRVMEIVKENEKNRSSSYIAMQKKELVERTNLALQRGGKDDYEAIYNMFHNSFYDAAIEKNSELGIIKEMIYLWKEINILNDNGLFAGVHSIEQAERRYLQTKFILFRIENDCNYEVCVQELQKLLNDNISCAFMAWQIKANMSMKREMYLKLSEYLWAINPTRGLEMISYGLFDFPEDADLLMYKANYLLELQCYKEALDTLKLIREPNQDILEIIEELENALGVAQ